MKLIGKKGLTGFVEIFIKIMMICAVGVMASMPWWLETHLQNRYRLLYYRPYLILILVSGVIAEIIMFMACRLMHNINQSKPFVMENSRFLRNIAICCVLLSVEFIIAIPFTESLFVALIGAAFAMVALLCFVFAEMFKQAVIFKEENELTV